MKKGKIRSISSEEYSKGRIDIFDIEETPFLHRNLIAFISDLGFKDKRNILKFDTDFSLFDGIIFIYENNLRITLIWEKTKKLLIDSKKKKEEIIKLLERHFKIF